MERRTLDFTPATEVSELVISFSEMVLVSHGPGEQPAKTRIIGHTRVRAKTSPPRGTSSRSLFSSKFAEGEADERPFSPPSGWDRPPSRSDLSRDVSKGHLIRGSSQRGSRNLGLEVDPLEFTEPEAAPEPSPQHEQAPWSEPWASRRTTNRQREPATLGQATLELSSPPHTPANGRRTPINTFARSASAAAALPHVGRTLYTREFNARQVHVRGTPPEKVSRPATSQGLGDLADDDGERSAAAAAAGAAAGVAPPAAWLRYRLAGQSHAAAPSRASSRNLADAVAEAGVHPKP